MRAMQITTLDGPMQMVEIAPPEPAEGEVRIRVRACGVNFADTLMRAGRYQEKPTLPFVPGMEVCGTVDKLGPGVRGQTRPSPMPSGPAVEAAWANGHGRSRRSCRTPSS